MTTIVRGTMPAAEFAMHHTLSAVPELRVEGEQLVQSGEKSVMPLVWLQGADPDTVEDALAADSTVESVSRLSTFEDGQLCRIEWAGHVRYLLEMVTNGKATVLDIRGRDDRWYLRVLYPTREHFSRTHTFATEHGLPFDVTSIREMEAEPAGRFGLTEGQHDVLVRAATQGYFDVPQATDLGGLAADCDVSHQALSERLRRGIGTLVEETLLVGAGPDRLDESSS